MMMMMMMMKLWSFEGVVARRVCMGEYVCVCVCNGGGGIFFVHAGRWITGPPSISLSLCVCMCLSLFSKISGKIQRAIYPCIYMENPRLSTAYMGKQCQIMSQFPCGGFPSSLFPSCLIRWVSDLLQTARIRWNSVRVLLYYYIAQKKGGGGGRWERNTERRDMCVCVCILRERDK